MTVFAESDGAGMLHLWDTVTGRYELRDTADRVIQSRPMTPAEIAARPDPPEKVNDAAMRTGLGAALDANRDFLALASPTNAHVLAQVRALTRQTSRLIRLTLGRLDGAD